MTLGWKNSWAQYYWLYETFLEIRPYKKTLGVWFRVSRTCSWDVRYAADFKADGFGWERRQYYETGSDFDNEIYLPQSIFIPMSMLLMNSTSHGLFKDLNYLIWNAI